MLATLPKATAHGLGGDGQFYAVLARNLAEGIGSFWIPSFSETLLSAFYEHPPLGIGIQSIFFRIFGDSYLVEKLYSVGTLLIIQFFMVLIWFRLFKTDVRMRKLVWLPLLFLILIPTVTHSVGNNVLENTMGVFTIIAMYSLLRSIDNGINYLWLLLGSLMIVLAIITKGPVGSFLLAFYPIYFITTKSISTRTTIVSTVLLVLSFVILFALLLINDDARSSLGHYFNGQVMGSLKDGRGMAKGSHFFIVWEMLNDLLPLFIFLIGLFIFKAKNIKLNLDNNEFRYAVLFILIGISASIPSMLSLKQNVTYIVTSYPYFAFGFAVLATLMFKPEEKDEIKAGDSLLSSMSVSGKLVSVVSLIGIIAVLIFSFSNFDRILKQENYIYDANAFSKKITNETIMGLCSKSEIPWDVHSFFARYYRISLDTATPYNHKYFIGIEGCEPKAQNENFKYQLINSEFKYLKLYELTSMNN